MARKKKGNPVHGWINLDKPKGMTSMQAVAAVRRILNAQKAGHAGTLDPMATGILPIALGEATKTIHFTMDAPKTYEFTVQWGAQTNTDDAEGEVIETSDMRPAKEAIERILPEFTGIISQTPPQFSAIKIKGQRAYDIARRGDAADIKPREVEIESLKLLEFNAESNTACFEMQCSKGTYVRALARDMGIKLGCLGHVTVLRRTKVGNFLEKNAFLLEKLEKIGQSAPTESLLPVQTVLDDILALALTAEEADRLQSGQPLKFITKQDMHRLDDFENGDQTLAMLGETPIAIVEIKKPIARPVRVLNL